MKSFTHLFGIFYPDVCISCNNPLLDQEKLICLSCKFDLPLLDNNDFKENATTAVFNGRIRIHYGASLMQFLHKGKAQKIIHELKYKGNEEIGIFLGAIFGKILKESCCFTEVDYIIPVPLHRKKFKKRGYNQLTKFGKELSKILDIPYVENQLIRINDTKTQTRKNRFDRFKNTSLKFDLNNRKIFENRHVLLIDDIITTGATMEACCKELMKTNNIKMSIASIAITT